MATYQVTYWQEIPSQVEARDETGAVKKQMLSQRFQELIDIIATKRELDSSDDYIAQWNKSEKRERPGSAPEAAHAIIEELETQFDQIRSNALQQSGAKTG